MITHKYTFNKQERLNKKVEINKLFSESYSFTIYPLRFLYVINNDPENSVPVKLLVSVPKRIHKRAVKRNLLKRRIKEAYRKIKPSFLEETLFKKTKINLAIIYTSNEVLPYNEINKKVNLGIKKLLTEVERRESSF